MKTQSRPRPRDLDASIEFSDRLALAIRSTGLTYQEVAKELGGFNAEAIRSLVRGEDGRVPLSLIVALANWGVIHKCSLDWLFAGVGESGDSARGSVPPSPARIATTLQDHLLLAIARKVGVDI